MALGALAAAQAALCGAYLAGLAMGDAPAVLDFDLEANLPTWWSSVVLLAIAAACAGIWAIGRAEGAPRRRWLLASLGFAGLSLEEVAQVHEQVGVLVGGGREAVSVWPLAYLPILVVGAWIVVRCLADLRRPLALVAGTGLALYVVVLATELAAISADRRGAAQVLIEENAEFLGTTLILLALAMTIAERWPAVRPGMARWLAGRRGGALGPRWLLWSALAFAAVQAALTFGYAAARLTGEAPLRIDLDWEGNLPAWWSSTLLLAIAGLCAVAALVPRPVRHHWVVAAVAFAALSLHEVAQAERLVGAAREQLPTPVVVVAAALAAGVLAWALLPCLRDLGRLAGATALVAVAAYAVGMVDEAFGPDRRGSADVLVTETAQFLALLALLVVVGGLADRRARAWALAALGRPAEARPAAAGPEPAEGAPAPS